MAHKEVDMKRKLKHIRPREMTLVRGLVLALALVVPAGSLAAQTAILADGVRFPDGTIQATAVAPGEAPLGDSGQQRCYDPTGMTTDEIPCNGTGQDGEIRAGVDWPTPRFIGNLDGTVLDKLTGLTWLQDASCDSVGPMNFEDSLAAVNGLADGACGLSDGSVAGDWRLPNVREMLSLADYSETGPALPPGHPFDDVASFAYWTSTSQASDPADAWTYLATSGLVTSFPKGVGSNLPAWPVRGGR